MTAVVRSEIIDVAPQADGRRYVTEVHTTDGGATYQRTYLADADLDIAAACAQYAVSLAEQLSAG